jgi:hypothetical protein
MFSDIVLAKSSGAETLHFRGEREHLAEAHGVPTQGVLRIRNTPPQFALFRLGHRPIPSRAPRGNAEGGEGFTEETLREVKGLRKKP